MTPAVRDDVAALTLSGHVIPYVIDRSKRARRIRLVVGPEPHVRIVVPYRTTRISARELLEPHLRWIVQQLERVRQAASVPGAPRTAVPPSYLGQELRVEVRSGKRRAVRLDGDSIEVTLPGGEEHAASVVLEQWFRAQARVMLTLEAEQWAERMGVSYRRIFIKDQRTRWGSCSESGNLNFNWRLVMAPLPVLTYVVIHELMHLIEPNHSPAFWSGLAQFCPDYPEQRRWLRQNGELLSAVFSADAGS